MYCDQCAKTEAELKRACLELARVRDEYCALLMELQCREKDLARVREELKQERLLRDERIGVAFRDGQEAERERTERVARRAALLARRVKDGDYEHSTDEAVAQAMREEGRESRPARHALNCSGYYGNEPCDCGAV